VWLAPREGSLSGARGAGRAAVAIAALWAGGAWLFCGFGPASLAEDGLVAEGSTMGVASLGPGADGGSLRMVSRPGTLVYLDDETTALAVSPFADVRVAPGRHEVRLHGGPGSLDERVEFVMPEGETLALVPLEPTLSFRDLAAALVATDAPLRRTLEERREPDVRTVVTVVFCAWVTAALAIASAAPGSSRSLWARLAMTAPLGLVLLLRAAVLAPFVPLAGWVAMGTAVFVASIVAYRHAAEGALEPAAWRAGRLLARFEWWVLDAVSSAAVGLLWALAWASAWVDARAVAGPLDAVSVRIGRVARRVEPAAGGSLAPVAWLFLAGLAVAVATASFVANR
jgi:hypothetical protein